jgi:carbon monoxide dehydrogenase subunit G
MITVRRHFDVTADPADVFTYLSDFTNTEQWDPGTVRTTRVDNGRLGEGAKFHNVSKFAGRETELDYELSTMTPTSHLVFTGKNKTVTSADDLSFVPNGSGTAITYEARFEFHGVARLVEPVLRLALERVADKTVEQMRRTLEAAA